MLDEAGSAPTPAVFWSTLTHCALCRNTGMSDYTCFSRRVTQMQNKSRRSSNIWQLTDRMTDEASFNCQDKSSLYSEMLYRRCQSKRNTKILRENWNPSLESSRLVLRWTAQIISTPDVLSSRNAQIKITSPLFCHQATSQWVMKVLLDHVILFLFTGINTQQQNSCFLHSQNSNVSYYTSELH